MVALEKPTTRKLLQLHLSTALVLMVLAAGLLLLNVRETETTSYRKYLAEGLYRGWMRKPHYGQTHGRGWPYHFENYNYWDDIRILSGRSNWEFMVINILVALALLAVAGVGVEWVVRRRGNRR